MFSDSLKMNVLAVSQRDSTRALKTGLVAETFAGRQNLAPRLPANGFRQMR
jgi:hypothetical protein